MPTITDVFVHPALLAVRWQGHTFVDTALPFWTLLSTKNLYSIGRWLAWVWLVRASPVSFIIWMIFFCAPALSQECHCALSIAVPLCESLGFPVSTDKVGPSTIITFLGIELDSVASGEGRSLEINIGEMAGTPCCHQEAAAIHNWSAGQCISSGASGLVFSTGSNRDNEDSKVSRPLRPA